MAGSRRLALRVDPRVEDSVTVERIEPDWHVPAGLTTADGVALAWSASPVSIYILHDGRPACNGRRVDWILQTLFLTYYVENDRTKANRKKME